ncbi:hypothetical protein LOC67_07005 [Stieleria sp. JC731]|uniref:hypothetical protein n=1 Tax=Pirellulaceae TaxID=2691357 RepID=UPI001E57B0DE|nr:hypothetical protein [Stieleria sp. JC731]MCC9600305.1 hypothetical protein [Stieleria sp. JC731]
MSQEPNSEDQKSPSDDSKPYVITPEVFLARMTEIANRPMDSEDQHGDADVLMMETLRSLGYDEGIDAFENMDRWYP